MAVDLKQALKWKQELTPKRGYNVVAIDDMGPPEDHGPYLVDHFTSREEADRVCAEHTKRTSETCYVYAGTQND